MSIANDPLTVIARSVMHHPIIACQPDATIGEVARAMAEHRIHAVVVEGLEDGAGGERLVWGVISDLDLVGALAAADNVPAGVIAGTETLCVDVYDELSDVAARLVEHGCSHAVVTEDDRPVGIVSTLDIINAFAGA